MKKATLLTAYAILTGKGEVTEETKAAVIAEFEKEFNRDAEEKAAKAAEYESVKEIILAPLNEAIMTISELYEAIKNELPDGFTRGKVQYAITKLYADEVVKHEGKPCTYGRKA